VVTGGVQSGQVIARVRASDADAGANAVLTYALEADDAHAHRMFTIAPETGEIRLQKNNDQNGPKTRSNDVDKETLYHLVVVASDGGTIKRVLC